MKDLEVSSESTKINKNTKEEIETELKESIVKAERHKKTKNKERIRTVEKHEDAATVIQGDHQK